MSSPALELRQSLPINPYFRYFAGEELHYMTSLDPHAFQVLMRLRVYAWKTGGIPISDDDTMRPVLRSVHCTIRKFRNKLWKLLEPFFVENSGFWMFLDDERQRVAICQDRVKSIENGRLGGLRRVENQKQKELYGQGGVDQEGVKQPSLAEPTSTGSVQEDLLTNRQPASQPDPEGEEGRAAGWQD